MIDLGNKILKNIDLKPQQESISKNILNMPYFTKFNQIENQPIQPQRTEPITASNFKSGRITRSKSN